jgi:ubiquinone/menaquinone biosynthesis C-methylase UbiE
MTLAERTSLGGFSQVDAAPEAAALIAALDDQASLPAIQRLRAAAAALLRPRLGARLLDVGCGTGEVVRALAGLVGTHGSVVGVEPSATMVDEARRRTGQGNLRVEFRAGDIARLDFEDAAFDGVTCERVFQHLVAPETAIGELVRVTRPGGRIVVTDTDWGMHAIHGADPGITARITGFWSDNAANGWSGRRLARLFADAGVREPVVVAETLTSTDGRRPTGPPFTTMAAAAERAGALTADEAQTWLAQLADAGERGEFFWAVTMFAVAGARPWTAGATRLSGPDIQMRGSNP